MANDDIEEKRHPGKDLLGWLIDNERLEFGDVTTGDEVRQVIGLILPEIGTREEFNRAALAELGAVGYCRTQLLNEGKYWEGRHGDYRILLPSEIAPQIESMIVQADRKLGRALKLSRNAPALDGATNDQTSARILMKREGLKRHRKAEKE